MQSIHALFLSHVEIQEPNCMRAKSQKINHLICSFTERHVPCHTTHTSYGDLRPSHAKTTAARTPKSCNFKRKPLWNCLSSTGIRYTYKYSRLGAGKNKMHIYTYIYTYCFNHCVTATVHYTIFYIPIQSPNWTNSLTLYRNCCESIGGLGLESWTAERLGQATVQFMAVKQQTTHSDTFSHGTAASLATCDGTGGKAGKWEGGGCSSNRTLGLWYTTPYVG